MNIQWIWCANVQICIINSCDSPSLVSLGVFLFHKVCLYTQFCQNVCTELHIVICCIMFLYSSHSLESLYEPCTKSNSNFVCIYKTNHNIWCMCDLVPPFLWGPIWKLDLESKDMFRKWEHFAESLLMWRVVWGIRLVLMAEVSIRFWLRLCQWRFSQV